ncbi:IS66-like element accessory protein TnpA [Sulfitobacter sp. PM12]|uniref:IS66-like element accessory protein TnpA n=1 Tax=Sulfitobacter sp. PM12 TaxID=3138497 RepID=UPI00389034EF|tara:strand:- start:470 stop:898 length:429 start_codon:yes stop_codon:yes gene_type:complete
MSDHRYRPEVEILSVTDTGRRRRWTDEEKVRIVEESFGGRGRVAETARRHDIGRTLLVRWRRQYREGRLMTGNEARPRFTPLAIATPDAPEGHDGPFAPVPTPATAQVQMADITLMNGRRLSVAATIDPMALARLVQALDPS